MVFANAGHTFTHIAGRRFDTVALAGPAGALTAIAYRFGAGTCQDTSRPKPPVPVSPSKLTRRSH